MKRHMINRHAAFFLLLLILVSLVGCEKKVPSVGVSGVASRRTETAEQTEPPETMESFQTEDGISGHDHVAEAYDIDRDSHEYICKICNERIKSDHVFPIATEPCTKCMAKRYDYASGYSVIKMYDGLGNITLERFYDAEGNMAYSRTYRYNYQDAMVTERTDYENNIFVGKHIYTYNPDGTVTDTFYDVDGVPVSETVN